MHTSRAGDLFNQECLGRNIDNTRTVFKKTGRKSGINKQNTRFYISVPGNSLQDQSKDQQSII